MPVLKNVLGLDLGSHSIKAVELQQTFRGASAAQLRSLPRVGDEVVIAYLHGDPDQPPRGIDDGAAGVTWMHAAIHLDVGQ